MKLNRRDFLTGAGAILGANAIAAPVRSLLSPLGILEPVLAPPTASDYIQDGIVAMWDGIENAGWGVHDPSATVWRDLVTGREAVFTGSTPTWVSDGFNFVPAQAWFKLAQSDDIREVVLNGNVTSESCVGSVSSQANNNGMFGIGCRSYQKTGFGMKFNTLTNYVFDFYARGGSININIGRNGENATWHGIIDGTRVAVGVNANNLRQRTLTADTVIPEGEQLLIGAVINSATFKLKGVLHALRLYSRALTPEEIRYNHLIDRLRFNLP